MGSSARGDQRCVDAGRVLLAVVIYRNDSHFEQFRPENTQSASHDHDLWNPLDPTIEMALRRELIRVEEDCVSQPLVDVRDREEE